MRDFFHILFGLLRCVILVALGAGAVAVTLAGENCRGMDCWAWVLDALGSRKETVLAAGMGLLVLEVLFVATRPARRGAGGTIRLRGKGGAVSVETQAVTGELAGLADGIPEIAELVPTVHARRKSVDIDLAIRVRRGADVPALCRTLQEQARTAFAEHVGLVAVRHVEVRIVEFVKGPPRAESRAGAAEETPAATAPEESETA